MKGAKVRRVVRKPTEVEVRRAARKIQRRVGWFNGWATSKTSEWECCMDASRAILSAVFGKGARK